MTRTSRIGLLSIVCLCAVAIPSLFATLTLTTNTNSVSMPFLTTDYNASTGAAQIIKTTAHTLTVTSTASTWTLSVHALTSTFSFTPSAGDPNPNRPASDLAVRVPIFSSNWTVLTTSNQVLATGPKMGSAQARPVDYRLNSNLNADPPGSYSISVIYTLTSP